MKFNYPASIPYIPEYIRVSLGPPDNNSFIVTVSYIDYIKNVASSELYPDWPYEALKANIYAIISFTLNRVFTEWYPSRGYGFDITNSTAYDQAFVNGRNFFDNISEIVDEIFNDYIRAIGQIQPLFAGYCDGKMSSCNGLSQWGSVELANQGLTALEILKYYYGNDIEIVENAPILNIGESYPGYPLREGYSSLAVQRIQIILNKIRETYSAIPPIPQENGVFDEYTKSAVLEFQKIFALTQDGIVGKATWYCLQRVFISLLRLSELNSLGLDYGYITDSYEYNLSPGSIGFMVELMQFFLKYISNFNEYITPLHITGTYDELTEQSVRSFQAFYGLPETGSVNAETSRKIYSVYLGTSERGENN